LLAPNQAESDTLDRPDSQLRSIHFLDSLQDKKFLRTRYDSTVFITESEGFSLLLDSIRADTTLSTLEKMVLYNASKVQANPELFVNKTIKNVSLMMFLMLPAFAMIFLVLFAGRGLYYIEHLVFSIHFHTFVFLAFTFLLALSTYLSTKAMVLAYMAIPFVYMLTAVHRVYGLNKMGSLWRSLVIALFYAVVLGTGLSVTSIISFLTL